jgi:hypothetical protein
MAQRIELPDHQDKNLRLVIWVHVLDPAELAAGYSEFQSLEMHFAA